MTRVIGALMEDGTAIESVVFEFQEDRAISIFVETGRIYRPVSTLEQMLASRYRQELI